MGSLSTVTKNSHCTTVKTCAAKNKQANKTGAFPARQVLCKARPHGLLRTTLGGEIYYRTLAKGTSCGVSKVEEELARRGGPWKGITQRKQNVQMWKMIEEFIGLNEDQCGWRVWDKTEGSARQA